jgi:thioredoxin reductase (NADPH)
MVVERQAVGGQAGTSSLIRNYPGFSRGISGTQLAYRSFQQAWSFGAEFLFFREAASLSAAGGERWLTLTDGSTVRGRTVVVAGGVDYRRLGLPALDDLVGRGVYYGAAVVEAPAMAGRSVLVVGGGNSAGQAALHLAKFARDVRIVVRGHGLAESMSDYLVAQIQSSRTIQLVTRTAVVGGRAEAGRLVEVELEHLDDHATQVVEAGGLFVLIGSSPHTDWLDGAVQRDAGGFVLTGSDVDRSQLADPAVVPMALETSLPGVFAVGDTRAGSVKRVATAVGDGAGVVALLHRYLAGVPTPAAGP